MPGLTISPLLPLAMQRVACGVQREPSQLPTVADDRRGLFTTHGELCTSAYVA